jgi:hypothetical protein
MPTIAILSGRIVIAQYYNDHDPPHFHVKRPGMDVDVRIADLTVIRGSIRATDLLTVRDRAQPRRAALALNWVMARAGLQMEMFLSP